MAAGGRRAVRAAAGAVGLARTTPRRSTAASTRDRRRTCRRTTVDGFVVSGSPDPDDAYGDDTAPLHAAPDAPRCGEARPQHLPSEQHQHACM
jgi:hypothetical protein